MLDKLKTIGMLVLATLAIGGGISLFLTVLAFFISILLYIIPLVVVIGVFGVIIGLVKLKINPLDLNQESKIQPKKQTKKKA